MHRHHEVAVSHAPIGSMTRRAIASEMGSNQNGRAVDVEYARVELPTGDRPHGSNFGVEGGLFESWFWIKSPNDPIVHDLNFASRADLVEVKGIGAATAGKIETERGKRPFADIADFRARVKPTPQEWKLMKDSVSILGTPFR